MKEQNSAEKLGFLLQKIMKIIHAQGRKELMKENLTFPQYYILSLLNKKGLGKMIDLKKDLFITGAGVTGIADHLVGKGLVRRKRSDRDRRVVNIEITDKGKKVIKKMISRRKDYLTSVLKKIDAEKKDLLMRGLESFASAIQG